MILRISSLNQARVLALAGVVGLSVWAGCRAGGNSPGGSAGSQTNGNGGSFTNGQGGSNSSGNGGSNSSGNGGSSQGNGGSSAGNGGSFGGAGGSQGGNGGSGNQGGSAGGGTGGSSGAGTGGSAGTGGARPDGGGAGDASVPRADASDAAVCTNTDMTVINVDSSARICNNQWGIKGAWYCYEDPLTANPSCFMNGTSTGINPFIAGRGMCISGTTSNSPTAFTGAGVGMELNNIMPTPASKQPYNTASPPGGGGAIIGFAITVTGDSGGSVFNINFPQLPTLYPPPAPNTGESATVTVPGLSGGTATYNVLIPQAMVADNSVFPPPAFNPQALSDVQVTVPGADGIAHNFNFCVTRIVPLTTAPAAPTALGNFGVPFTEGKQIVVEGMGPYGIVNDPVAPVGSHNTAMQAMWGGGQVGFSATPSFSGGTVGAYPSVLLGWVRGGYFVGGNDPGAYKGGKTIGPGANSLTMANT